MKNYLKDIQTKHSIYKYIALFSAILSIYLIFYILHYIYNNIIFPDPNIIIIDFFKLFIDKNIYRIFLFEIIKLLLIVLISFIIGIITSYVSYKYKYLKYYIDVFLTIFKSIPVVTIVSIFMIIIGLSYTPYIVSTIILIPVFNDNLYNGFINIDKDIKNSYELEKTNFINKLIKMELPLIKNNIKTALLTTFSLAFKVMITTEFICYTKNSFGSIIISEANNLNYIRVYSFSILIIIIVFIFDSLIKKINNK